MYLDASFNFGLPDITDSNTATVSTNVFNAGSAKTLFASGQHSSVPKVKWKTVITADAAPTILIEMVASAEATLTVAASERLGSSGIVETDEDGTALANGDIIEGTFAIGFQRNAFQYYGLMVTLGGTNPDIVAATSFAHVVMDAQTNMVNP